MKMIHKAWTLAALLLTLCVSHAQGVDPAQARSWAAGCANCHGTNGQAQPGMESLAGANAADLVKKMQDFKAGSKPATIMHQLSKGYSDEQIAAIATYFAAQKK